MSEQTEQNSITQSKEQQEAPVEEQEQQQQQENENDTAAASSPSKTTSNITEKDEAKENGTGDAEPVAETPKDMRAVVLTGFGGFKTVKILKKPEPTLNEGEVLIRVKAW